MSAQNERSRNDAAVVVVTALLTYFDLPEVNVKLIKILVAVTFPD